MTDRPTKDDFDRTLSTLATRALNQLQVERNQIKGQAAAIGALHGNRLIIAIADAADKIHVSTMAQVATTLHEFTQRMELSPIHGRGLGGEISETHCLRKFLKTGSPPIINALWLNIELSSSNGLMPRFAMW